MASYKSSVGSKLFDIFNYVFLFLFALTCFYPFIYMFSLATSEYVAIGYGDVKFLPIKFHWDTFKTILRGPTLLPLAYANSIIYTTMSVFLVLMLSSMGGFILSLPDLRFRKIFTAVLVVMMFVGGGMIPTFLWIRSLGLLNTMWAIVLPGAVAPFNMFIFRTYMRSNVPYALYESVYMDGGNNGQVYLRIVLPLIKPILATFGLFAAVGMWNSFVPALIYLNDPRKFPLTLFLRRYVILNELNQGLGKAMEERQTAEIYGDLQDHLFWKGFAESTKMTMTLLTVLPILFVYPFVQKYFIKGIIIGSIKGQ